MELFYTTITGEGDVCLDTDNSLGGFKSSTLFKNGDDENLFSLVSYYTIERDKTEYKCLVLQNTTQTDCFNISIQLDTPQLMQCVYSIGYELPNSVPNPYKYQHISDNYMMPRVEFASTISIPNLNVGEQVAIWIKREINKQNATIAGRNDPDFLYEIWKNGQVLAKKEEFDIVINYN